MTFSPDTKGQRVAPIRRNTSPCTESCEISLNFALQIRGWIIEKGKAEHLDQAGTFGRLDGQTDIAAGQRRKAIAISAAHGVTGSASPPGSRASTLTLFGVHPARLWWHFMAGVNVEIRLMKGFKVSCTPTYEFQLLPASQRSTKAEGKNRGIWYLSCTKEIKNGVEAMTHRQQSLRTKRTFS